MENNNDTHRIKRSSSAWLGEMRDFLRGRFSLDEDKAQRDEVVASISKGVVFLGGNLWVLIFATMIASLGLNVNSAPVIPGVAIATALIPPLCTAGIGLATGQMRFFFGAFYLFFINSVFIALATYAMVRFLKYEKKAFIDKVRERNVKRLMMVITFDVSGTPLDTPLVCVVTPKVASDSIDRVTLANWLRIRTKVANVKLFVEP